MVRPETPTEPPRARPRSSIALDRAEVKVVTGRPARPNTVTLSFGPALGLPWKLLIVSALAAQVFALPVFSFMGWFLASLVHEMGHSAMAWACGMPAFPAIRLDGHAAAVHSAQEPWLVFAIAAGLGALAWHRRHESKAQAIACGVLAVVVPMIAFSHRWRELAFLLMGHGGELVFAFLALLRAAAVHARGTLERGLYATVAWYLLWRNATLFFGLMTSLEALIHYYGSGSFGMTNDLIRAAEDVLDCSVQALAGGMFVATIAVLPLAFFLMVARARRSCA